VYETSIVLAYTAARDLTEVFSNLFLLFYEIHFDRKILLVVSLRQPPNNYYDVAMSAVFPASYCGYKW